MARQHHRERRFFAQQKHFLTQLMFVFSRTVPLTIKLLNFCHEYDGATELFALLLQFWVSAI